MNCATLSNDGDFTVFTYGNKILRFKSPYSLEKYISVKSWDAGYLVVMAKYRHNAEPEEEYIDITSILGHLFIDETNFLSQIKEVIIKYD